MADMKIILRILFMIKRYIHQLIMTSRPGQQQTAAGAPQISARMQQHYGSGSTVSDADTRTGTSFSSISTTGFFSEYPLACL